MYDVVAVITDVFFQARVRSAVRAARRSVAYVTPDAELSEMDGFSLALVDLDAEGNVQEAICRLRAIGSGVIVAFGPHVNTEARAAARAAGADRVIAKSKFVTALPAILAENAASQYDAAHVDA